MSRNTEDNEGYIKTGYEEALKEVFLNKRLKVIFINGVFGSGKTTILNYVLDKNKDDNEKLKIKKLKVYEEYVESNYIDYLYSNFRNEENKFCKWIKENIIYIILSVISFGFIIVSLLLKKFIINIGSSILFIIILFIVYIVFDFAKRKLEKSKVDKIKYIKKKISRYNYLIIDDLDRVYIKTNEILKMIHFLQENLNDKTKLILLGDKSKFKDQDIDVLEKYYDYIFEVPKEIVVQNLVYIIKQYIDKEYPVSYYDEHMEIEKILKQCVPRQLVKILDYLKVVKENDTLFEVISKLYRSDYLFMVVMYHTNRISLNRIVELIEKFNLKYRIQYSDEKLKDFDNHNINSVKKEIKLSEKEQEYLIDAYEKYTGIYAVNDIFTIERPQLTGDWRIISIPHSYNLNTFISNKDSLNILIENFEQNLYKDYEKTEYPINEVARSSLGLEKFEEIIFERIKKVDDIHSRELFNYIYNRVKLNTTPDINSHENINLQYYSKIIKSTNFSEIETYDSLNDILNDENWKELHCINKLDFLCREYYVEGVEQSRRDEVIKDSQEVIEILDKIIENPVMPSNFWYIFEDKIKSIPGIEEKYIDFILNDMKGRTNMLGEQDIQNGENIKAIEKAYKNNN